MNRVKDYRSLAIDVVGWLCKYANDNNVKSFVVGVSGGIDSAVSSTLAAKTGRPVYALGTVSYTHLTLPTICSV